jgi:WD40 repeat protein
MKLLYFVLLSLPLLAGVTELHGPPARQAARNLRTERNDGTSQFLEFSFTPVPNTNGFTRVEVYTGKREAGKFARLKLNERDVQLPNVLRFARELYDFSLPTFQGAAALAENRIAVISSAPVLNTTEFSLRTINPTSLILGRAITIPANPTGLALRPGSNEAWSIHSGTNNVIAISDLSIERLATTLPLRLLPQDVAVSLQFSPNGRTAYVVVRQAEGQASRGSVQVWDCVTRSLRSTVSLGSTQPVSALLSPDGSTLVVSGTWLNAFNTPAPSLSFFNTLSNTAEVALLGTGGLGSLATAEQMVFHPDGNRLFLLAVATLDTFDLQARRLVRNTPLPRGSRPNLLDISPYGEVLLLRDSLGLQSALVDTLTLEILDVQPFANGAGFLILRP